MRNLTKAWLIGVAGWGSTACGGATDTTSTIESEEDAKRVWEAMNDQLALVVAELDIQANASDSAELACEGGGTSKVTVSSFSNGSSGSATQKNELFGCVVGDLTMDGEATTTATATGNGVTVTLSVEIEGTVTFAGDPEGVCYMNVTADGSANGEPQISGTICGFPAADILEL